MIREFIANLHNGFNDPSNPNYQNVHVPSVCFLVSPPLSDDHPSTKALVMELTGGT